MHLKRTVRKWIPVIILLCFLWQTITHSSAGSSKDGSWDTDLRYNMSYVYFGSSASYIRHMDRTKDSLDEISPNYFNLNEDGTLALTSAVDQTFVDEMHRRGVSVVLFLSNHWDRGLGQAALSKREELVAFIVEAIRRYDLDGINVDLENLTDNERDQYTDLLRLLSEKLPDEKIIAVSVAANPYGITTGWKGSYDYEALGTYSDYLMIMTYDEHYQGGDPGPVSSLGFAEKSIQYALSKVPKEKIVLGIPFYGRIWNNGSSFPQGAGIGNEEAQMLIGQYEGKVVFDQETSAPYATITVKEKDQKPIINGKTIDAGTYTVWFENERSIKQKLQLIEKYHIKGTGSWSLGQETADTWDYYKLWSNGCHFDDVGNHWARDYIVKAYKKNWVKGATQTSFEPDRSLTRAEAAAMLVRLLKLPVNQGEEPGFSDVLGHWAQAEINAAKHHNIVDGVGNGYFDPDDPVTREQMAVMFYNVLNNLSVQGKGQSVMFPDVNLSSNPWSWQAIEEISKHGIVVGFADGYFRPKELLSRAQMAVMLGELAKITADSVK